MERTMYGVEKAYASVFLLTFLTYLSGSIIPLIMVPLTFPSRR